MEEQRHEAQLEAQEIVRRCIRMKSVRNISRETAKDELGYSWSNILDIKPHKRACTVDIEDAIALLRNKGYYVSVVNRGNNIVIEVSTSAEVINRHS